MTESSKEETGVENSWVEKTYNHWLKRCDLKGSDAERFALDQSLHKASLMEIKNWDNNVTPGEIADFLLKKVPGEIDWWVHGRNEKLTRFLEQNRHDPGFRRVFSVKSELISRMRGTTKEG